MKQNRLDCILELIREHEVGTQEELLNLLRESGFNVTQATVSRDIKALRLVKTLLNGGDYIYAASKTDNNNLSSKFDTLLLESTIKIDYVFNQIVIKCYSGLANAVCAALDSQHFEGMVGTIAGDDTILIIMRSEQQTRNLYSILQKKLS
jgi:transcriptional regulator of arginine metabolism